MANCTDTVTLSSTGASVNFTMPVAFTPTELHFQVGSKSGGTTSSQLCISNVDSGGYMTYISSAQDGTSFKNADGTNKVISVWEYVSGSWSEVMSASFVSFTSTGFRLNITAVNSNYQVKYFASN